MREFEEREVVKTDVETSVKSVGCNRCGVVTQLPDDEFESYYMTEQYAHFGTEFGYGSKYDGERWSFDLCEDCLDAIVKTFKVAPEGFAGRGWVPHDLQATFEKWRETGEIDIEAGMTAEQIAERGGSIYADYNEEEDD